MRNTKIIVAASVAAALSLACFGCSGSASNTAATNTTTNTATEETAADAEGTYVTADWVAANLGSIYVIDARSATTFYASHIPGAVSAHWSTLSNSSVAEGEKGWAELLSAEELATAFANEGITTDRPIVVYTKVADGWGEDGRIAWTLQQAGFSNVHILDGGWQAWIGGGYDTESENVGMAENVSPIKAVTTNYVKKAVKKGTATIVDARAAAEYNGETNMGEAKMGHIPGAVNVPNTSLFAQDGKILSDDELATIFNDAGLTDKSAEIITYCTGGVRAANVAEVLSNQGYTNVKVYTCSFAEWAGLGNKVEK